MRMTDVLTPQAPMWHRGVFYGYQVDDGRWLVPHEGQDLVPGGLVLWVVKHHDGLGWVNAMTGKVCDHMFAPDGTYTGMDGNHRIEVRDGRVLNIGVRQ